ncbi:MAG: hypothetical protein WBB69_11635 [Anaerolineales bacterium]
MNTRWWRKIINGTGFDATPADERTHQDALISTTRWVIAFLLN